MRRSPLVAVALAGALIAGCTGGGEARVVGPAPTTGPSTTAPGGPAPLVWGACEPDPAVPVPLDQRLECATLTVPADPDDPSLGTFDLALVRLPATGDREGAVLFNPGGPGGSGWDLVAYSVASRSSRLDPELTARFDLVGFDPRGVGRSDGVVCLDDAAKDAFVYADTTPDDPDEARVLAEAAAARRDGCARIGTGRLATIDTVNTARDMDRIREALGDEQLSFYGASYGTFLGATYASLFPDRVRAMVLDAPFDPAGPDGQDGFANLVLRFEGLEQAFDAWLAWCADPSSGCAFAGGDIGARWQALLDAADARPVPTSTDDRLANEEVLFVATIAALYQRSAWPVLATGLADAERRGDATVLFSLADAYAGRNPDGTWSNQEDANRVISCTSGFASRPPADPAQGLATLRAVAPRLAAELTVEQLADDPCGGLPVGPAPAPFSYRGDGPILLVGGAKDPVTPLAYAESMAASLGERARLLVWTGEGHTAFLGSRCVDRLVADVLVRRELPAPGTTCEPDPAVARPGWFDDLPAVPGASPLDLAGLEALLGFDPAELYAEFAAVADGVDAAAAAYERAFAAAGWDLLGRDVIEVAPDGSAVLAFGSRGRVVTVVLISRVALVELGGAAPIVARLPEGGTLAALVGQS